MVWIENFGLVLCAAALLSLPSIGDCQTSGILTQDLEEDVSAIPAKWELPKNGDRFSGGADARRLPTTDPMTTVSADTLDDRKGTDAESDLTTHEILYVAGNADLAVSNAVVGAESADVADLSPSVAGHIAAAVPSSGRVFNSDIPDAASASEVASTAGVAPSRQAAGAVGSFGLASIGQLASAAVARAPLVAPPSAAAAGSWLSTSTEDLIRAAPPLGTGGEVIGRPVK